MLCVRKGKVQNSVLQIVYAEPSPKSGIEIFFLTQNPITRNQLTISPITVAGFKSFYIRKYNKNFHSYLFGNFESELFMNSVNPRDTSANVAYKKREGGLFQYDIFSNNNIRRL